MKIGRNDPCPCRSGKKYKKCCMRLEQLGGSGQAEAARSAGGGAIRRAAEQAAEWQADVVPVPMAIESDPDARPCAILVTAGGFVLANELIDRPAPEPEEVAGHLVRGLETAVNRVEGIPETLRVRRPDVAEALAVRLASSDPSPDRSYDLGRVAVRAGPLAELDDAAFSLIETVAGVRRDYLSCRTETWAAWSLPDETVARIFSAAAAFHRAAPWRVLANLDLLEARLGVEADGEPSAEPEPRTWSVGVMGRAGEEYGIALYSESDDFWSLVSRPRGDPASAFAGFAGEVVSLTFDPGHAVSPAMRREVSRAGWELAGPDAYPEIITINTLAGGLPRAHAEDLAAILEAVPRFTEEHTEAIDRARPVPAQTDRATGVTLAYKAEVGEGLRSPVPVAPTFPGPLEPLAPGFAEGPGADPEAAFDLIGDLGPDEIEEALEEELEIVDGFTDHLTEVAGLGEETVTQHGSNVEMFVELLVQDRGVPIRAVHEYHLRFFLYDWYPRKVVGPIADARSLPVSLKRFFAFLEQEEGISCPWAGPILAARDVFENRWESCPGHFFWDQDVMLWRLAHEQDLLERVMIPDDQLGEDDEWGATMGPTEAELMQELHGRWLLWRDEEIRAGRTSPDDLREALVERQRAWEAAPHPRLGRRKSPYQAIREEREEYQGVSADR